MISKSSRKTSGQVLGVLSKREAEKVLTEWANYAQAADQEAAIRRLVKQFPAIFNPIGPEAARIPNDPLFWGKPGHGFPIKTQSNIAVSGGRLLREAWDAQEQRRRDWYLTDLESFYHHAMNRFADPPRRATPLEAVIHYFRHNRRWARHCPNPDCVAPYFFSKAKGQEHCSSECAKLAQRAAKLRWWHENKNATKERRKAAQETSSGE